MIFAMAKKVYLKANLSICKKLIEKAPAKKHLNEAIQDLFASIGSFNRKQRQKVVSNDPDL
jgi:hypothetical protein